MSDVIEPFEPEYVRPEPAPCPNCVCCAAALCERGRGSAKQCHGLTPEEYRETVYGCPCSAATTRGTYAYKLALIRVTRLATEMPLLPPVESLLRTLVDGEEVDVEAEGLALLKVRGLVDVLDDRVVLTSLGRRYLVARGEHRYRTPVEVLSVDMKARTVGAVVVGWHMTEPVTLLLDQVAAESKVPPVELVAGMFLEAEANCRTEDVEELVLTDIRVAPPLPAGWMNGGGPDA